MKIVSLSGKIIIMRPTSLLIHSGANNPAVKQLLTNWGANAFDAKRGITPSTRHYPHNYLWDSWFIAIIFAHFNEPNLAAMQITATLDGQKPNGFIPNMRFNPQDKSRRFTPERFTFMDWSFGSDYTQPPLLAQAVWETYQSYKRNGLQIEGKKFLQITYPSTSQLYEYFSQFRQNSRESVLVGIIHPHETGRDSDPTYDYIRQPRIPYNSNKRGRFMRNLTCLANTALDYANIMRLNLKLRNVGWDTTKARKIFWANDVMFNCIYAQNLTYLAKVAGELMHKKDAASYKALSQKVQKQIHTLMWNRQDLRYYALDNKKNPTKTISISNLFPIILEPNKAQTQSIIDLLASKEYFSTEYPIPSVPTSDPNYDPDFREKRLWRGPVWINMNWYVIRGLLKQARKFKSKNAAISIKCETLAKQIAGKTFSMVNKKGCWEFYHPQTGEGMRLQNFAWSALGYIKFPKNNQP